MVLQISREQARRFLARYHFLATDLPGVFDHLGTVQYDPLNPVGRNPDLVFQARIPGYQVDDWQKTAYTDRVIYDAWDKMACLVPVSDWPMRALIRTRHRPYHDRDILHNDPQGVALVLSAIARWWWEPALTPDAEILHALRTAATRFLHYLRASALCVGEEVDKAVRDALQSV